MSAISCQEVVAQLLRLARGEVQAQFVQAVRRHMYPDARCWDDVWTGDVRFRVGDWLIDFFSDVGEVDYVARVQTPDGRVGIFDDWGDGDFDGPLSEIEHVDPAAHTAIEQAIIGARA